jgi:hypothetical protein
MPTVEPVVTREKLGELLKEQTESETLDYKATCDLNDTRQLVELAKDVGAMSILGGFLVIGADNHGNPTNDLSEEAARSFDDATLRAKLKKYIPEPFEIRTGIHQLNEKWLVVVYVAPHPSGLCIFKADGSYPDSGKTKSAFFAGQIFARHGSSSEPWRQEDIPRILSNLISREKEKWRAELRRELVEISGAASAQSVAQGPAVLLTWQIDAETFTSAVVEQLRRSDTIPLKLLLARIPDDARQILEHPERWEELQTLLDRLICLAALFQVLEERNWFERVITTLLLIYRLGFDKHRNPMEKPFHGHTLWLSVIKRVFALGALAVRQKDWISVKMLAVQEPSNKESSSYYYPNWVRHALTMGYRRNAFVTQEDGRETQVSPLNLARNEVRQEKCLHPDLPSEDDGILDSLCQFDILGALAAIATVKEIDTRVWYPCFSHYYTHRTEPAIKQLLADNSMRQVIFPLSDKEFANALRWLNDVATKEGWNYLGWDGFKDETIKSFIQRHAALP